jgi:hypothetical protein
MYRSGAAGETFVIEVRPRAGTWGPFVAAVPLAEKDEVSLSLSHGPSNRLPLGGMMMTTTQPTSVQGDWWVDEAHNEATPIQSYFIRCKALPSILRFGVPGAAGPAYQVTLDELKRLPVKNPTP